MNSEKGEEEERNNKLSVAISELAQKLSQCPSLSNVSPKLDNDFLTKYLMGRNLNVDQARISIENYFKMRSSRPELFQLPSKVKNVFDDGIFRIPEKLNSKGSEMVLLVRPGNWDVSKYDAYHLAAAPVPFLELAATSKQTQDHGMIEVMNFKDITWKQFWNFPASLHSVIADLTERALPLCYKRVHVVNEGKLVDILWAALRPFVSAEMKARIVFHGTKFDQLHEEVDTDLLPAELGGTLPPPSPLDPVHVSQLDDQIKALWDKYSE